MNKKLSLLAAATALTLLATPSAYAQKAYDTGVTDTEIKIGNVEAYSGPASAYGIIGKTEEAYFKMINDQGGINGRKINWISYDDGYSPPKTVEQIRKLIESDEVFLVFNALGTPTQTAVQKYHNSKKVPQLFLATGASKWNDPKNFPWTMGFQPSYRVEAQIFAKYILKEKPDAKVAIFYANDDFGKDYLAGIKDVFGDKASKLIVAEESYETSEPSIDAHIVKLKGTGADVFVNIATPKFAAQAIKKIAELEWKPMHLMTDVCGVDRRGDEAGRPRSIRGRAVGRLPEGCVGSAVEGRRGHEEVHDLHRQVHARCEHLGRQSGVRLCRSPDDGAGAEAVG
ncbi:ABC-type branched-subunit amino acid transport system substrate-binding protein [Bradyrhizobium japonicum]